MCNLMNSVYFFACCLNIVVTVVYIAMTAIICYFCNGGFCFMKNDELRSPFTTRQYMLSEDYEIYFYSDLRIKPTPLHAHPYYEFIFFVQGDAVMVTGNRTFTLQPGDMVLIPPGVPHHSVIRNPEILYQRFIFWISTELCEHFGKMSDDYRLVFSLSKEKDCYRHHYETLEFNRIQTYLFDILRERHFERYGRDARIQILIQSLILSINRSAYETVHPPAAKKEVDLNQKILDYIDNHLSEDISLDSIADHFYVSKSHISHTIKTGTGLSTNRYIKKKRLELFRTMLVSTNDINTACHDCGFTEYSTFFRAFKEEYGISPGDYKKQLIEERKIFAEKKEI